MFLETGVICGGALGREDGALMTRSKQENSCVFPSLLSCPHLCRLWDRKGLNRSETHMGKEAQVRNPSKDCFSNQEEQELVSPSTLV